MKKIYTHALNRLDTQLAYISIDMYKYQFIIIHQPVFHQSVSKLALVREYVHFEGCDHSITAFALGAMKRNKSKH